MLVPSMNKIMKSYMTVASQWWKLYMGCFECFVHWVDRCRVISHMICSINSKQNHRIIQSHHHHIHNINPNQADEYQTMIRRRKMAWFLTMLFFSRKGIKRSQTLIRVPIFLISLNHMISIFDEKKFINTTSLLLAYVVQ